MSDKAVDSQTSIRARLAEECRHYAKVVSKEADVRRKAAADHRCSLSAWGHLVSITSVLNQAAEALLASEAGVLPQQDNLRAWLTDFVLRERGLRDSLTKGGQHVGRSPSISVSTLRELEYMLKHSGGLLPAPAEPPFQPNEAAAMAAGCIRGLLQRSDLAIDDMTRSRMQTVVDILAESFHLAVDPPRGWKPGDPLWTTALPAQAPRGETPSAACASCGSTQVAERIEEDHWNIAYEGLPEMVASVPVMRCEACGQQWTDYRAEAIKDSIHAAVKPRWAPDAQQKGPK